MRNTIIRSFSIYETRDILLLVGVCWDMEKKSNSNEGFKVIEIRRPVANNVTIEAIHHATTYSKREITELITIHVASLLYSNCFCLVGMIQLLRSYYLMVVTKAEVVATIHGREVFTVQDSVLVPITFKMRNTFDDSRYKSIFQNAQFSKGFYFSFSLDITNSLQPLSFEAVASPAYRFLWNSHLLDNFYGLFYAQKDFNTVDIALNSWIVFMIHGFVYQQNFPLVDGRCIRYTLISRRSQYFAGTRYLRRGVNADGHVANEVETEQIITLEDSFSRYGCYRSSSLLQLRGSLPLCWSHNNLFAPNPDIFIDTDDVAYRLTRLHLNDMANRYGARFHVLNLIRMSDSHREKKLGKEMKSAVSSLSSMDFDSKLIPQSQDDAYSVEDHEYVIVSESHSMKLRYICYDVLAYEHEQQSVFDVLSDISKSVLPDTGFFLQGEVKFSNEGRHTTRTVTHKLQEGILRTNCVDCLDRTNIAQFCYAKQSLNEQLKALGVELTPSALDALQLLILDIWVQNGDFLALQYAGSEAMHKVEEKKRPNFFAIDTATLGEASVGTVTDVATSQRQEVRQGKDTEYVLSSSTYKAIAAVRRYYSNVSFDFERQRAMDLLLGVYQRSEFNHKHIWEIDQSPHIMRGSNAPSTFKTLKAICDKGKLFQSIFPVSPTSKDKSLRCRKLMKAAQLRGAYHQDDFFSRSSLTSFESIVNQSFNKHSGNQLSAHDPVLEVGDMSKHAVVDRLPPPALTSRGGIAYDDEDKAIEAEFLAYLGKEYCVTDTNEVDAILASIPTTDYSRVSRIFYERSLRKISIPLDSVMNTKMTIDLFSSTESIATPNSGPFKNTCPLRKKEKRKSAGSELGSNTIDDFLTFFPRLEEGETESELDPPKELRPSQGVRLDVFGEGLKSFMTGISFGLPELSSNSTSEEGSLSSKTNAAAAPAEARTDHEVSPPVFSFPSKWFSFT